MFLDWQEGMRLEAPGLSPPSVGMTLVCTRRRRVDRCGQVRWGCSRACVLQTPLLLWRWDGPSLQQAPPPPLLSGSPGPCPVDLTGSTSRFLSHESPGCLHSQDVFSLAQSRGGAPRRTRFRFSSLCLAVCWLKLTSPSFFYITSFCLFGDSSCICSSASRSPLASGLSVLKRICHFVV